MARMSGTSPLGIIFKEMMPNLTPYILASFVASVSGAILATVGLEALGLGPADDSTLGRMIYLNIFYGTVLHGLWWWLIAPIAVLVVLFVGLFMISAGLDEVANPATATARVVRLHQEAITLPPNIYSRKSDDNRRSCS